MTGAWEKSLDEVLLKFGVTKETLQENAAEELESTLERQKHNNAPENLMVFPSQAAHAKWYAEHDEEVV